MKLNKKFMKVSVIGATILAAGVMTGCTDANRAAMAAWGEEAVVLAYSGGELTYAGISTGKIKSEANSDGYYFKDKCKNGKLVEIGGDVNILRHPTGGSLECSKLPEVETPTYNF